VRLSCPPFVTPNYCLGSDVHPERAMSELEKPDCPPTAARVTEALAATIMIQRWARSAHAAAGVNGTGTGIVMSVAERRVERAVRRVDERAVKRVERASADAAPILVATAATAQPGAVPRGKRSQPAATAAATATGTAAVIATVVTPADASWLEDGCAALVARAASGRSEKSAAQRAKDSDEARARSAALSTKADTTGVQFRGREFQRLYLESKYVRRASLIYQLLGTVLEAPGPSAAKELFTAQLTAAGSGKQRLEVCSVGGGPGTDAAGVVAANQRWLGFRAGGARSAPPAALTAARAVVAEAAKAAATARERSEAHARRAAATADKVSSLREAEATALAAAATSPAAAARALKATAACDKAAAAAAAAADSATAAAEATAAADGRLAAATAAVAPLAAAAKEGGAGSAAGSAAGGGAGGAAGGASGDSDAVAAAPLHLSLLDLEPQWKSYTHTLAQLFAPRGASVGFEVCDVAAAGGACSDATIATLGRADALIFAFVLHETSLAAEATDWAFYRALGHRCKAGAVLIFADVIGRAAQCFAQVQSSMAEGLAHQAMADWLANRGSGGDGGSGGRRELRRVPLADGLGLALHAELMVLHIVEV